MNNTTDRVHVKESKSTYDTKLIPYASISLTKLNKFDKYYLLSNNLI